MFIAIPIFFMVLLCYIFYQQYGIVPCLTIPPGLLFLAFAWFAFILPPYEILVFPCLVVTALCFSAAFAFRRSAQAANERMWEKREQAREQYQAWRADRNSETVQSAWAKREPFFVPKSRS